MAYREWRQGCVPSIWDERDGIFAGHMNSVDFYGKCKENIPYMDGVFVWQKTRTEEKNGSRFVSFFCVRSGLVP